MTDEQQSEGGKRERSSVAAVVVLLLVALPFLYVFSTGPIIWLESHGYISGEPPTVVKYIYAPIRILLEDRETCKKFFKLWASLWEP